MTERGESVAGLAAHCGVSHNAARKWIAGESHSPTPKHIFALADRLGVSARWLATGEGPREAVAGYLGGDARIARMVAAVASMEAYKVNLLEAIVDVLSDSSVTGHELQAARLPAPKKTAA